MPRHRIPHGSGSLFWVIPALCVCAAIGLASGMVAVNHVFNVVSPLLFQGPPSGARTSLNSIITAMISLTGLVFSVTFVALQLTAGQLSPRVLQIFLRDRIIQVTFGVFVATFVYATVVLQTVRGDSSNAEVPRLAVSVAFLLVFASAGVFTLYIGHLAQMMRASTLIAEIAHQSNKVLERQYPLGPNNPKTFDRLPPLERVVVAPRAGMLIAVNESALAKLAAQAACVIVVQRRQGDYVPSGAALFALHGEPDNAERLVGRANKQFLLGAERTPTQDLAFGFRQLTDIANRALSASTNDPTTACRAIDALHDLLRQLIGRPPALEGVCGPDGALRLLVPRYQFAELLDMAIGEIWHYGSEEVQVPGRIAEMLADLNEVARPEHQAAVHHWLSIVKGA